VVAVTKAHNIYKSKKLIRISLDYSDDSNIKVIQSIKITGDFFLYPEEALDILEAKLTGTKFERDAIKRIIESSLADCETFGFDSGSLTDAIMGCLTPPTLC
jgi:lipoate---protein ligase